MNLLGMRTQDVRSAFFEVDSSCRFLFSLAAVEVDDENLLGMRTQSSIFLA